MACLCSVSLAASLPSGELAAFFCWFIGKTVYLTEVFSDVILHVRAVSGLRMPGMVRFVLSVHINRCYRVLVHFSSSVVCCPCVQRGEQPWVDCVSRESGTSVQRIWRWCCGWFICVALLSGGTTIMVTDFEFNKRQSFGKYVVMGHAIYGVLSVTT